MPFPRAQRQHTSIYLSAQGLTVLSHKNPRVAHRRKPNWITITQPIVHRRPLERELKNSKPSPTCPRSAVCHSLSSQPNPPKEHPVLFQRPPQREEYIKQSFVLSNTNNLCSPNNHPQVFLAQKARASSLVVENTDCFFLDASIFRYRPFLPFYSIQIQQILPAVQKMLCPLLLHCLRLRQDDRSHQPPGREGWARATKRNAAAAAARQQRKGTIGKPLTT